jgi:murein DD-endopeptidase MepM/ murein hydrolase activator NlpD
MRKLIVLIVFVGIAATAWIVAGRAPGPDINIVWPTTAIGQKGEMFVEFRSPKGRLSAIDAELIQNGRQIPFVSTTADDSSRFRSDSNVVRMRMPIGKQTSPELQEGPVKLVVRASRLTLFGLQQAWTTVERDIVVRLTPPRAEVLSHLHYINHAGSEMAVYRAVGNVFESGVRVGDRDYRGFPASGAGVSTTDTTLMVAFFALLWDQDTKTPISVFARDDAGNEATATFDYRVFPKNFRQSRIDVDDKFLARVVPAILQNSPELRVNNPSNLPESYVAINRDLRELNNATIASLAARTSPTKLWDGPFRQLINTAVEAGFADRRTYFYNNIEIDKQTHLGFDLASTAAAPVHVANNGVVLFAGWLGIYGNCVIVDHGMGLQSLYAHLSSIQAKEGDTVRTNDVLGKTGATGLAGGDHLHFTMLLGGNPVNPVDWWSAQWVEDRILRKLSEAASAPR